MDDFQGKRAAIVAIDGFEQSELEIPQRALSDVGIEVDLIAPREGDIRGWDGMDWGSQRHAG